MNVPLSLLLSVSDFVPFFVSVFVNWCFFVMCEFDDFFHVAGCEKDSCCEGITWEELKSHCNMSSLLFYVKYALCISTTIKGIETFSTMCN